MTYACAKCSCKPHKGDSLHIYILIQKYSAQPPNHHPSCGSGWCHQPTTLCCVSPAETGHVTSERVARLCGDHLEHCYEASRLTTHGTICVSVAYHTDPPAAAPAGGQATSAQAACGPSCSAATEHHLLVCATSTNSIAVFNAANSTCVAQHNKGPKRCSSAFTPSLSHVAVYGDPMAPAIELQLCSLGKFAFLEGHTGDCAPSKQPLPQPWFALALSCGTAAAGQQGVIASLLWDGLATVLCTVLQSI